MEDVTTLIWIGIGIVWFLSRLVRRGARKLAGKQKQAPPTAATRPPAAAASRPAAEPRFTGTGSTGPPPIVPR